MSPGLQMKLENLVTLSLFFLLKFVNIENLKQ